jgi:hypothetical protein
VKKTAIILTVSLCIKHGEHFNFNAPTKQVGTNYVECLRAVGSNGEVCWQYVEVET